MPIHRQPALFDSEAPGVLPSTSGTFAPNLKLPVHRWFKYSAGFSGAWARAVIEEQSVDKPARVFDPFSGSGTTLIAAEECGVPGFGVDPHPFVARIAQAKLAYRDSVADFSETVRRILRQVDSRKADVASCPQLLNRCYSPQALERLDCLRQEVLEVPWDRPEGKLAWLCLTGILRKCSHVGTANWQYLLPNQSKSKVADPYFAFESLAGVFIEDMNKASGLAGPRGIFHCSDARNCPEILTDSVDLVVTSPPYPNNFDYADATRLELTFWGEVEKWGDLQDRIRKHLMRSCTQHVPEKAVDFEATVLHPDLDPIRAKLMPIVNELAEVRKTKGGKKTYHLMVLCYFLDLAQVWSELRRVCASPSKICFVIGDSAPYGVYVPVMELLSDLALAAGFSSASFEKIRDRNIKWKNRKHRVPLCEGRLWLEG